MTNPVPADVHALVGAYAIDAVDESERAGFEQHLAECAECRHEVQTLREAATALAATTMLAPPPALRDRVLAGLGTVEQLPPPPGTTAPTPAAVDRAVDGAHRADVVMLPRRKVRVAALAVAAATIAAIGLGSVVVDSFQDDPPPTVAPTLTQRLATAEDADVVVETGEDWKATVVRSSELGRAMIVTENMPAPPPGKVYQLWFQDVDRGMVPAGVMPPGSDQTVLLQGQAERAEAVGITIEPAPGSSVPTSEPIALFPLDTAQS